VWGPRVSCGEVLGPVMGIEITFEGVSGPRILLHILAENDEYFRLVCIKSWYRYMTNLHIRL